ncbi:hypothetical protein AB0B31_15275 [Catellatospora citrea]|uniref:hypothetical protein n=1 Tax=Catellatospora citrea TaxID=53366 RepID=UPI0033C2B95F
MTRPSAAQPAPPTIPAASRIGITQHKVQATPASEPRLPGRRRRSLSIIGVLVVEGSERNRAAVGRGADGQVVTAGVDRGSQARSDDLQVGDLRLDLGEFGRRPRLQTAVTAAAVPVDAEVHKVGDLGEGA